ncbi:ATPase [Rhizodiscina lignyota]|uniref:ATPase n=1 Tax=Rhizodiscina lignyota TaxID=1504668 RepID=A0A9P4IQ27_9PEZI|nr:ATPase [Rhizodiscina lignyota]
MVELTVSDAAPSLAAGSKAVDLVVHGEVAKGVNCLSTANGDSSADSSDSDTVNGESKADGTVEVEKGSVSTVKSIYRSAQDEDGEWTWVDEYPKDVKEAAENEETEKFALIVRSQKSKDSRKKLEAHSIVIQSPWLKGALSEILDDYPGVTCELHRLVFDAPFAPFIHRWASFLKFMKRADLDQTTQEHLRLLFDILKYEIGDKIKDFEDYVLNGVITFESLWMIFQPGGVIVAAHKGPLSAFELINSEYVKLQCGVFLRLDCDCVEWDGENFGRYTEEIFLPTFSGTKKIVNLKAMPLPFFEGKERLEASLVDRGKKFEQLAGHHYKAYDGQAITWDDRGNEKTIQLSGRIIVDTGSFNRFSPYECRYINNFNEKDVEKLSKHNASNGNDDGPKDDGIDGESADEPKRVKLTPYHQMLCRSRVRGYSLKTKKWLDFFVPLVSDIKWNNNAFDSLVLPDDQKDMVLAFSESQVLNRAAFDDVIAGKGRGIIMLLSGSPGVGKTLTAEAVAEHMRCPLHSITSGDLGSAPWQVEQALTRALELVSRWNAVLLIDECDVFLEARSEHDLERNQMVSIFLRVLEYYEGILFMTTNRVDNIDAAFESRIHVSIPYPDLNDSSRRHIWANFIKTAAHESDLSDRDLDELSLVQLNGRQIKNVLKTAQLLAMRKKRHLNRAFVETVLTIQGRRPNMQK